MIKNAKKLLTLAIAIVGCSAAATAQTATASATVSAKIITPISISKVADMDFGNIVADADGGTVVLSTAGVTTATGVTIPATAGSVTAAEFTVEGEDGFTYDLALPTSAELTTGTGAATEKMTVGTFTSNATKKLTGGSETVKIGATLTLVANQSAGTYTSSSSFEVGVNYN